MATSTINKTEFINVIKNVKNCKFAQLKQITEPSYIGRNNPYKGRVLKVTDMKIYIYSDYQKSVNSRLEKKGLEPKFKAAPLPWGHWLIENKIIEHTPKNTNEIKHYLRYYCPKNSGAVSTYYIDGIEVVENSAEYQDLMQWIKTDKSSNTQAAAGLAEDEQIVVRVVDLNNIININLDGTKNLLLQEDAVAERIAGRA